MKQYDLQNLYCKNYIFGLHFVWKFIVSVVTGQCPDPKKEVATDTIKLVHAKRQEIEMTK